MEAIILAGVAYIGWGVGDIFGTMVARKIGPYSLAFWAYLSALILATFYIPFALTDLQNITPEVLILNIILGIILLVAFITFYEGVKVSNASLVGTIAASFAAPTVILSLIFLGESINFAQVLAILIIFAGLILSSIELKSIKTGQLIHDRGIIFALITMVCWAVYFTFIKIPIQQIGWFWPHYISLTVLPLLYLYFRFQKIQIHNVNTKNIFLLIALETVLVGIGTFTYNAALGRGLTSIVAPIAGAYPTLFVFLAFLVFKDPITRQQIAGIITTLIGIVLLSFLSV